ASPNPLQRRGLKKTFSSLHFGGDLEGLIAPYFAMTAFYNHFIRIGHLVLTMKKSIIPIVLLAAMALGQLKASAQGKPLFTAPIGVQAYTFRSSMPKATSAVLDTIKSLGITEIEGEGPKGMPPEEFKKMCDDRGISIPSTGAGYDAIVNDPGSVIKLAKILGAKYVMVAWIPHGKEFTLDDAKKAAADFNRIGKILSEAGLTFCYHNHG
ncbi:MAG: sugar phosphate isomerase/epimerase, partial [Mucilaginibacter sp.]|nr:sugar phosphate isomerase/epimerase [Mucilaginibacter sp.]